MASIPVSGELWRAAAYCYSGTQLSINRTDYLVGATTGGGVQDSACVAQLDSLANGPYKAAMNVTARYYGFKFWRIYPRAVAAPVVVFANNGPGTVGSAATALPPGLTGILSKQPFGYGRGKTGRWQLPFLDSSFLTTDGKLTAAYVALALAISSPLINAIVVSSGGASTVLTAVIASKKVAGGYDPIIGTQVNFEPGQLHRRSFYGRQNTIPPF